MQLNAGVANTVDGTKFGGCIRERPSRRFLECRPSSSSVPALVLSNYVVIIVFLISGIFKGRDTKVTTFSGPCPHWRNRRVHETQACASSQLNFSLASKVYSGERSNGMAFLGEGEE